MRLLTLVLLIMPLISCQVIELEQDVEDETNSLIDGPQEVPSERDSVMHLLHGDVNKIWQAEGFTILGMSGFLNCRLDDSMTLFNDGTYIYDGGNSLCGAEDDTRIKEGTWSISDDLSTLIFKEGNLTHQADLLGISNDQIRLRGGYQGLELNAVYTSN
ncbi:MAG: hypothetical protein RJQ09_04525 [Cyclobacteriaceae bacterium]